MNRRLSPVIPFDVMNSLRIVSIIGIAMGLMLLIFAAAAHKKLPSFMLLIFLAVGVLIIISSAMIFAGASALNV